MEKDALDYFLFPDLILPEACLRNFFIFLPRLSILEVSRRAAIPPYARDRFRTLPAIADAELQQQVNACITAYGEFARMHSGSGTLGYLSRTLEDMSDSRFKIQEHLREGCPTGLDPAKADLVRSAAFLEIARELDERESELESSLAQADTLEKKFSEILGISDETDALEMHQSLERPLASNSPAGRYMLSARVESWFRIFSANPPDSRPVFVAAVPEAVEDAMDAIRTGIGRKGTKIKPARLSLGSFPRLDQLGEKQLRSIMEAPGAPPLLESYRENLDCFFQSAAGGAEIGALENEAESLRQKLENFCSMCAIPGPDRVALTLEMPMGVSLGEAIDILGARGEQAQVAPREAAELKAMFLSLA